MLDSPASLHLNNVPQHNLKISTKHKASPLSRHQARLLTKGAARRSRIRRNLRLNPRHHRRQPPRRSRLRIRPISNFHNPNNRCSNRNILRSHSRNRILNKAHKAHKACSRARNPRRP